jgi:hypothetical protein
MTNQEMIDKLSRDFPGHVFKTVEIIDKETSQPKHILEIDGARPEINWASSEMPESIFHHSGVLAEEMDQAIYDIIADEIRIYFQTKRD